MATGVGTVLVGTTRVGTTDVGCGTNNVGCTTAVGGLMTRGVSFPTSGKSMVGVAVAVKIGVAVGVNVGSSTSGSCNRLTRALSPEASSVGVEVGSSSSKANSGATISSPSGRSGSLDSLPLEGSTVHASTPIRATVIATPMIIGVRETRLRLRFRRVLTCPPLDRTCQGIRSFSFTLL